MKILGDTSQLLSELDVADQRLQRFGRRADRLGQQLTRGGTALTAGLTLPLLGLGFAAGKAFIDFEDSFAGIRKTMDLTEDEFGRLEQANRDLAKSIPVSVNELNRIGELAGQLGIRGVDNVVKFEETIAKIAVTTDLTADQAALAFAQIANVVGLPQDQIDRLGAAVVGLGNNFATTESKIVDFTQRIAGAGALAGLSVGDITGIATAFTSVGENAEAGGTAVQKVLLSMRQALVAGGNELEVFASTAGVSTQEFARLLEQNAAEAFTRFVEGLGRQGDQAIATLEALSLQDQRLIRSFLAVANAGDLVREAVGRGNQEFADNVALTEEAAKRFETARSQLTLFWNRLKDVGITLGAVLVPAFLAALEAAEPLFAAVELGAKVFASLPGPVQTAVILFGALVAAIGPLLVVIGGMASGLGAIIAVLPLVTAGFATLSAVLLASPAGWVALGAAAIAAGVGFLFVRDQMKGAEEQAQRAAQAAELAAEMTSEQVRGRIAALALERDAIEERIGALLRQMEAERQAGSIHGETIRQLDALTGESDALTERIDVLRQALELTEGQERAVAEATAEIEAAMESALGSFNSATGAVRGLAQAYGELTGATLAAAIAEQIFDAEVAAAMGDVQTQVAILNGLSDDLVLMASVFGREGRIAEILEGLTAPFQPVSPGGGGGAGGAGGGVPAAVTAADRRARALEQMEERRMSMLVEAFFTGGDSAVRRLEREFDLIDAEFARLIPKLRELGVQVPEEWLDELERARLKTEQISGQMIGGLLGFLISRRLSAGLDPGAGLIDVAPSVRAQLDPRNGGAGQQVYIDQINITPDSRVPGGIDTQAGVNIVRQAFSEVG